MGGRQERVEPLDRAHDLSSLSGEVEAVARGDHSNATVPGSLHHVVRNGPETEAGHTSR